MLESDSLCLGDEPSSSDDEQSSPQLRQISSGIDPIQLAVDCIELAQGGMLNEVIVAEVLAENKIEQINGDDDDDDFDISQQGTVPVPLLYGIALGCTMTKSSSSRSSKDRLHYLTRSILAKRNTILQILVVCRGAKRKTISWNLVRQGPRHSRSST